MPLYRTKPVVKEAIQFNGENAKEICDWSGISVSISPVLEPSDINPSGVYLQIKTLEGVMTANLGDYIIKGLRGEFYPCKPDIFEKTYELAEE